MSVLDPLTARALSDIFNREAGLAFADDSAYVLERKLRERLSALGLSSFAEYLEHLRGPNGRRELEDALELVTTHETYFFREDYQLRAFREEVLPALRSMRKEHRRLTIWSAGCSTGEEAFTIAMVIDASGLFRGWDVRIIGTDLSRRCIAAARKGVYGATAFRATPVEFASNHYFVETDAGRVVAKEIRHMCTFAQANLLDSSKCTVVGRVDAIFCRNVLIYLDAPARQQVVDNLYEQLVPGGFLMLGHSESLLNAPTRFAPVHLRDDLVYRRPERPSVRPSRI